MAGAIKHVKPTAVGWVPHHVTQVSKSMVCYFAKALKAGMHCNSGRESGHSRLIFQHLRLRTGLLPPAIEITREPTVLLINGAREPGVQSLDEGRRKLLC